MHNSIHQQKKTLFHENLEILWQMLRVIQYTYFDLSPNMGFLACKKLKFLL